MQMMIEEEDTFPLIEVISTLDVMIDLGSAKLTDNNTIQLSQNSFIGTLSMIKDRLKAVEQKLTPMS